MKGPYPLTHGRHFWRPLVDSTVARAIVFCGLVHSAAAIPVLLTFEGLQDGQFVADFYNRPASALGIGVGYDYRVEFKGGGAGLVDADAGGTGNFGFEPSPSTALYFPSTPPVMNVLDGFTGELSFFYTSVFAPGEVKIYDDLNATGSLIAQLVLPVTSSLAGDPGGRFSPFFSVELEFSGLAKSVVFGGGANNIIYDDIAFTSLTPAPPPPEPPPLPPEPPVTEVPEAQTWAASVLTAVAGVWMARRKMVRG